MAYADTLMILYAPTYQIAPKPLKFLMQYQPLNFIYMSTPRGKAWGPKWVKSLTLGCFLIEKRKK